MEQQQQQQQAEQGKEKHPGFAEQIARQISQAHLGEAITGEIDMRVYGLNVGQFTELNKRLKELFDQLRNEGTLPSEARFSVMSRGRPADSLLDDMEKIHRDLESADHGLQAGAITPNQYLATLTRLQRNMSAFNEAISTFLNIASGVDADTPEGIEAMKGKADEYTKGEGVTE
jgi:polyhydroxyalkanoate synthesis regulator phasin